MKLPPAFDSIFQTKWLPSKDSNLEREIQNLLCYHYTKGQYAGESHSQYRRGVNAGVESDQSAQKSAFL